MIDIDIDIDIECKGNYSATLNNMKLVLRASGVNYRGSYRYMSSNMYYLLLF